MNHGAEIERLRSIGRLAVQGILGSVLLGLAGLLGCNSLQTRLQSDDDADHYYVETIGDNTTVGNAAPIPVGGVGLVVGLEGTGGDCAHDVYRAMLVNDLEKDKVRHVKEVMTSANHAMVLVSGQIQPGSSKDDPIDLEVTLPPKSQATSLRGGYLSKCLLFNYDFAERLSANPDPSGPHGLLKGHAIVEAEDRLLVGLGEGDDSVRVKRGRIWGGGRCLRGEPFSLIMNPDHQFGRVTALIAQRINDTFQAGFRDDTNSAVAVAKENMYVILRVPPQYRLNTPRFLRVTRFIPYTPDTNLLNMPINKGEDHRSYRQRIADDLLDPARTVTAALRLEALGSISIPSLKKGLESRHPLVRFCSAEALAYLGDPQCGEELGTAVARSPILRAFALTAMASLDEVACQLQLRKLVTTGHDDETRYGAFRALRALNPRDELVRGELLNESFWLHQVAPHGAPMVHISSTRRAEIVLFGEAPMLRPPATGNLGLYAGEFVITASKDDDHCMISRLPVHGAAVRRTCSLELVKVMQTLAEMGCLYPEAVTLLQQADAGRALSCRVRCDALPQAVTAQQLELLGRAKSNAGDAEAELIPADQDLGVTPTLFDNGLSSHSSRVRQQKILLEDAKPPKDKQTASLEE